MHKRSRRKESAQRGDRTDCRSQPQFWCGFAATAFFREEIADWRAVSHGVGCELAAHLEAEWSHRSAAARGPGGGQPSRLDERKEAVETRWKHLRATAVDNEVDNGDQKDKIEIDGLNEPVQVIQFVVHPLVNPLGIVWVI